MWQLLTEDLGGMILRPWLQMVLVLVSVICGAIVGAEREKHEKPAGLRTLVMVCLGSTAFTLASYAFTTTTGDSGRVAAQIVTGIGFLGAGAILHGAGLVTGLTTAATIWVTAATGMIVGTGYAGAGLGLSLLARAVLTGIHTWEVRRVARIPPAIVELLLQPDGGKTRLHIEKILDDFHVHDGLVETEPAPGATIRATLKFSLPRHRRCEFLHELASLSPVLEIREKENHSPAQR